MSEPGHLLASGNFNDPSCLVEAGCCHQASVKAERNGLNPVLMSELGDFIAGADLKYPCVY
jgi:hypothetical protein